MRQIALLYLFNAASCMLMCGGVQRAYAEETHTLWIGEGASRCERPLPLRVGRQLIFELPYEVKVAAPSAQGLVEVHIAPQLVVVRALESGWGAQAHVGLSLVFQQGGTLYCELTAPRDPSELTPALVHVRLATQRANTLRAALSLIDQRLNERLNKGLNEGLNTPQAPLTELESAVEVELQDKLSALKRSWQAESLLKTLSRHPLTLSQRPPLRAQEGLIYLTLTQRFWLGGQVWLRASLINRSQPTFELESLSLRRTGRADERLVTSPERVAVSADGVEHPFATTLTHAQLYQAGEATAQLVARARDGREVTLALPDEL